MSHTPPRRPTGAFATTHWSVILNAGRADSEDAERAMEELCRSYWPAVHAFLRRLGNPPEVAREMTQEFFARMLSRGWLTVADPARGKFRTFLRTVLERFVVDEYHRGQAQKRGGGKSIVSLDELELDEQGIPARTGLTPEQEFDRRWALATLDRAFARLTAEAREGGHGTLFESVRGLLSGGEAEGTLAEIAARLGVTESAVKMRLHRWRARYRQLVREEVANTVPAAADLDEELRHLMAALVE